MESFTKAENDRVDFLIKELTLPRRNELRIDVLFDYDDDIFQFAIEEHPKAEEFYNNWV